MSVDERHAAVDELERQLLAELHARIGKLESEATAAIYEAIDALHDRADGIEPAPSAGPWAPMALRAVAGDN